MRVVLILACLALTVAVVHASRAADSDEVVDSADSFDSVEFEEGDMLDKPRGQQRQRQRQRQRRQRTGGRRRRGKKPAPVYEPGKAGDALTKLVALPTGTNSGLTSPKPATNIKWFGDPGCKKQCGCNAPSNKMITDGLTKVWASPHCTIHAQKPFGEAVARALLAMKNSGKPEVVKAYNEVNCEQGGYCCRAVCPKKDKPTKNFSNHSFGLATDFRFGATFQKPIQYGITLMVPYFNAEKLYWGGAYKNNQDGMHFEASQELVAQWRASGALKTNA